MAVRPVLVAWSGGKDSALALREIRGDGRYRVAALLTTVTAEYDRISMHGVRRALLRRQAESLGLPLEEVLISPGSSNDEYETNMAAALAALRTRMPALDTVVFGDLCLADIRAYPPNQYSGMNRASASSPGRTSCRGPSNPRHTNRRGPISRP